MTMHTYELVIVGGGPAGASCALYAQRLGLEVLLVDQRRFPRDKICGDLIPRKGTICLEELGLLAALEQLPHCRPAAVVFSSPKSRSAAIPFTPSTPEWQDDRYVCYVCRRALFDNLLFQEAKRRVETWEEFQVQDVPFDHGQVCGVIGKDARGKTVEVSARVVVGADGYRSRVGRRVRPERRDPAHWAVATRAYYRDVKGVEEAIEIHFVEAILPGYFWIFPVGDGLVNVGIGMLHQELKKRRLNLRQAHLAAIQAGSFRERFREAEMLGEIVGWHLPLGSRRRQVHGNGFMLAGDAAGLVNPFSGEGIGNAMWSGRLAAQVMAEATRASDYSAAALQPYASRLWAELGPELVLSRSLQRLGRYRPLLELVIGRAAESAQVRDWIALMLAGRISKKVLKSPLTYLRLLFS